MPRGIPKKKSEQPQDSTQTQMQDQQSHAETQDQAPNSKTNPEQTRARELERKIASLEAKIKAGEEATLDRVCKALGIEPDEVQAAESKKKEQKPEPIIRCFVPNPVRVNMMIYHGMVDVPYSTFEVIQQAIGDRRMRLMRELTGNNYILQEVQGVGYVPKLIGQVDVSGERIAVL